MITKTDWNAVHQRMRAEGRHKHGEIPTAEELLAYSRGELSASDEARVREVLVCYPELVRALITPFPEDDARPGDLDYLSDDELSQRLASLRRTVAPPDRSLRFWRISAALAAGVALALGLLLAGARSRFEKPRVFWEENLLSEDDARRGPGDSWTPIVPTGDSVLLVLRLGNAQFAGYRLELADVTKESPRVIWSETSPHAAPEGSLSVIVPSAYLKPGRYQFILRDADGSHIGSYGFRVPATSSAR